jgi:hypothetical protein
MAGTVTSVSWLGDRRRPRLNAVAANISFQSPEPDAYLTVVEIY